jgi:uncharacterized protein
MEMQWEGKEEVAASKERLWAFINDPASVANCMPDLVEAIVQDGSHVEATVKVGLGPVKGNFKLKIELLPEAGGSHMSMKISGGGLGSVVDLIAGADITDNGNATTTLDWSGTAEMRGQIANMAGRVIDSQARRVINTTFANVKAKCGSQSA